MRLISFHPFRSLGIPGVIHKKPGQVFADLDEIRAADWVLFPESWQVNFLTYGLKRRIFPSISSYHLGRDKVEMTRAFWTVAPENVPHTVILQATPESAEKALDELGLPLVVKEPRNSMGRGVELIESRRQLLAWVERAEVLYAQEYLETDRDLRVVVVGDEVAAAYWKIGGDGFRHNVAKGGELSTDGVPEEAVELVRRVAAALEVDHAGFDLLWVHGRAFLLELNVFFGNRGLDSSSLGPLIQAYLESRTDREPFDPPLLRAV